MGTGLTDRSANESLSAVNDSSLPVFETAKDIHHYIAQSDTLKSIETCLKPVSLLSYLWRVIRELSGDDAYERYIAQHAINYPDATPLARKDFFLSQQQKQWSGIQRCC